MHFLFYITLCLFFSFKATAFQSYADLVDVLMPSVVNISTENMALDSEEQFNNVMINHITSNQSLTS